MTESVAMNIQKILYFTFLFFSCFQGKILLGDSEQEKIAILGDSIALGAATHPSLSLDPEVLTRIMKGEVSLAPGNDPRLEKYLDSKSLGPPRLLWSGIRDYWNSGERVFGHLLESFTKTYFSTSEYSWSYLVGRKLNFDSKNILIGAEYGAKVERLSRQFDRVLDANNSQSPSKVFIFFTGNDLCSGSMNLITSSDDFGQSLSKGVVYFLRNAKIPESGTKIYIPYFLPITQLLDKESILSHNVGTSKKSLNCRDLRKNGYKSQSAETSVENFYLNLFLPPNFAEKCPTLFAHDALAAGQTSFFANFDASKKQKEIKTLSREYRSSIATLIRNYRSQTDHAVAKINLWIKENKLEKKVHVHALSRTAEIDFEGKDLAPDCFHLGLNGQMKIADAILGELADLK